MTIKEALKKLHKKMTGVDATTNTAAKLINELADNYTGGGGGDLSAYSTTEESLLQSINEAIKQINCNYNGSAYYFQTQFDTMESDTPESTVEDTIKKQFYRWLTINVGMSSNTITSITNSSVPMLYEDMASAIYEALEDKYDYDIEHETITTDTIFSVYVMQSLGGLESRINQYALAFFPLAGFTNEDFTKLAIQRAISVTNVEYNGSWFYFKTSFQTSNVEPESTANASIQKQFYAWLTMDSNFSKSEVEEIIGTMEAVYENMANAIYEKLSNLYDTGSYNITFEMFVMQKLGKLERRMINYVGALFPVSQ